MVEILGAVLVVKGQHCGWIPGDYTSTRGTYFSMPCSVEQISVCLLAIV